MSFEKLEEVKKKRIINASLRLFASFGYKNTSTDAITTEAGISKGLLFHYFGTKKNLYLYLYDYSIKFIIDELTKHNLDNINDFFEYIEKAIELKWKVIEKHPHIYEFLISSVKEEEKDIKEVINTKLLNAQNNSWQEILTQADISRFKNPDDAPLIINLIKYSSSGLMKEFISKDVDDIKNQALEFKKILKMLKRNFYKEDYL